MKTLRERMGGPAVSAPFTLVPARVHEVGGSGRRTFAVFQAMRDSSTVIWILPAHERQRLMPEGLPDGLSKRLLLVKAQSETELLWATEECLRAAPVGMVVAEPEKPLSLTAGRRLQLAAEAGTTTGLMLIHAGQGSNAAETRWDCAPAIGSGDSTYHSWKLNKNKTGTLGSWTVDWNGASAAFNLVSEAGK